MSKRKFLIEVTMPSGERLQPIPIDRDAFLLAPAHEVGAEIGRLVARLVEQRLKA